VPAVAIKGASALVSTPKTHRIVMNIVLYAILMAGACDLGAAGSLAGQDARQRLSFGVYPGGHMFYLNGASRAELFKDVSTFYH
jgi:hypothetical protein